MFQLFSLSTLIHQKQKNVLHDANNSGFGLMFACLFDFLHCLLSLVRRFRFRSSNRHDLDTSKIRLESLIEKEAVCFRNIS